MQEDESKSRRKFLGFAMGGIFGAMAFGYLAPMLNYLIRPSLARSENDWSDLGPLDAIPEGKPTSVSFTLRSREGWSTREEGHNVWVVRKAGGRLDVFSPTCPHLGCGYHWNEAADRFICPCHASVYTVDGEVVSGPAPRRLDTLPAKVEGGNLYVKWERFRLGVSEKLVA